MKKIIYIIFLLAQASSMFSQGFADLDVNSIKARIHANGQLFSHNGLPKYEFPKGKGRHANYAAGIWMAGYTSSTNELLTSVQTYNGSATEFWPGPLFNGTISVTESALWNKVWKVNRSALDSFFVALPHTTANTPASILDWPAKGNPYCKDANNASVAIPSKLAPFVDVNNDGLYNPLDGDYPEIKGEQMLWWVFNDLTTHPVTSSSPLFIQVCGSAYGCNSDVNLHNVTYYSYEITSFATTTLDSCVFSFWNDADLGYGFDDFLGFDSTRRMAICYNGDHNDEGGYGTALTQTGFLLLTAKGDNGVQRMPAGSFLPYNSAVDPAMGNPVTSSDFYHYMRGRWKDALPITKSCNLRQTNAASTPYAFPDDPSVSGLSEVTCNNTPNDKRFVLNSSVFQVVPGQESFKFEYAILNTEEGSSNENFSALRNLADYVIGHPLSCGILYPTSVNQTEHHDAVIYPNPVSDQLYMYWPGVAEYDITITDLSGRIISRSRSIAEKTQLETSLLASGIYILRLQQGNQQLVKRIVID